MALIDVTALLVDPDFASVFHVERRIQYIDDHGRAIESRERFYDCSGSIQPISGKTLDLFPDLIRSSDQLEIWTTTRLSAPTERTAGDIVIWQEREYTVDAVRDWSDWGAGFVVAVVSMRAFVAADPPP